jgi:hypothetical protein
VLIGELKIIIFKEAVHKDDELAHAGGHGDEGLLSCCAQAQIERFEDAVVAHGTQGRHEERAPHGGTFAAFAAAFAKNKSSVVMLKILCWTTPCV